MCVVASANVRACPTPSPRDFPVAGCRRDVSCVCVASVTATAGTYSSAYALKCSEQQHFFVFLNQYNRFTAKRNQRNIIYLWVSRDGFLDNWVKAGGCLAARCTRGSRDLPGGDGYMLRH